MKKPWREQIIKKDGKENNFFEICSFLASRGIVIKTLNKNGFNRNTPFWDEKKLKKYFSENIIDHYGKQGLNDFENRLIDTFKYMEDGGDQNVPYEDYFDKLEHEMVKFQ